MSTLQHQPVQPAFVTYAKQNPSQMGLLVLLLVVTVFLSSGNSGGKKKLAKGHFAGATEKKKALHTMKKQIKGAKLSQIAFSIRKPGKKGFLALPHSQPGVLALGSPGFGKTASVINPALRSSIDQKHRIILFDWKYPGQAADIVPYAKAKGYKISVFAPGFPESQRINPLDLIRDSEDLVGAKALAYSMINNNSEEDSQNKFFTDNAVTLLASLFCLAKTTEYPDLLTIQKILTLPKLPKRLESSAMDIFLKLNLGQFISSQGSDRQLAGILNTTIMPLTEFLLGSNLLNTIIGKSTCKLLLEPGEMLVVGMDRSNSAALKPLIAAVLSLVGKINLLNKEEFPVVVATSPNLKPEEAKPHFKIFSSRKKASAPKKKRVPLVMSLDEMATINIPISEWLNQYRSEGLCALIGLQNPQQLPEKQKDAILAGIPTKVLFNPNEMATAKMFSEWAGKHEVSTDSKTKGFSSGKKSRSKSDRLQAVDLLQPADILKLPPGKALILNSGHSKAGESSIPFLHQFDFNKYDEQQEVACQDAWEKYIVPKLLKEAPVLPKHPEELVKERKKAIDKMLKPPKESKEKTAK